MSQTQTQTQTQTIRRTLLSTTIPPSSIPSPVPTFAKFNYYLPPPESSQSKPTTDDLELILGSKNQDTRRLPVHDLRGRFDEFELDQNGFQAMKLDSAEKGFEDDERIRRVYYPEIEALVRGI
jgi:hypothetical protein